VIFTAATVHLDPVY